MTDRRQFLKSVAVLGGLGVLPPVSKAPKLSDGLVFFTGTKPTKHVFCMDWIGFKTVPGGYWFTQCINGVTTRRFVQITTPAHD